MAGVLIVTDFILITLSELCFTGIISGVLKKRLLVWYSGEVGHVMVESTHYYHNARSGV